MRRERRAMLCSAQISCRSTLRKYRMQTNLWTASTGTHCRAWREHRSHFGSDSRLKPNGCVSSCSEGVELVSSRFGGVELVLKRCFDGVWEEWSNVLACRRSAHVCKNVSNVWKPAPSMLPDLHLSWSTSYKHHTPHTRLSWSTFHQNHQCMLSMLRQRLQCTPQMALVVEYIAPVPVTSYATPVPASDCRSSWRGTQLSRSDGACGTSSCGGIYFSPYPTVYVAPAPVVEYISPDPAEYAVAEYITPSPMEFVEAALTRLMRSFAVTILRSYATWHV